jgi:hypothetical protein
MASEDFPAPGEGFLLTEYIASACARPVRPDSPDESGPGTSSNRQSRGPAWT